MQINRTSRHHSSSHTPIGIKSKVIQALHLNSSDLPMGIKPKESSHKCRHRGSSPRHSIELSTFFSLEKHKKWLQQHVEVTLPERLDVILNKIILSSLEGFRHIEKDSPFNRGRVRNKKAKMFAQNRNCFKTQFDHVCLLPNDLVITYLRPCFFLET